MGDNEMNHSIGGSIYDRIKFHIELAGALPEDFELEEREHQENVLHFAPGAMEGIMGHHGVGSSGEQSLADTIKEYLGMSPEDAMTDFEVRVAKDGQMVSARRGICKVIFERKAEYNAGGLFRLARYFAENGMRIETVKLGLTLLALFDTGDMEEVRQVLRVLGSCEEFTDYVLTVADNWPDSIRQELYFTLAKKLHGWGKISAVERMEADTEEKKRWILCYGCENSVMNAYLGHVCAVKCDLRGRLERGFLTEEEFRGATEIMKGLLDEGPCAGLSALEEPAELVLSYLAECRLHDLDVDLVVVLADIRDYFCDEDAKTDVAAEVRTSDGAGCENVGDRMQVELKVDVLLADMDLEAFLSRNMADKPHQCIRIAQAFQVDVSGCLIGLMEKDFPKYYYFCHYLFGKDAFVDEFFAICEREIRENDYPNEMGDSLGFGAKERSLIGLDMIVQYLGKYPLRGKKMIRICLHSPITRWRNMAGKALCGWVKELGGTLEDIAPDLYAVVEDVAAVECNAGAREKWKRLLG